MEILVESDDESQSEKGFATTLFNFIKDIENPKIG